MTKEIDNNKFGLKKTKKSKNLLKNKKTTSLKNKANKKTQKSTNVYYSFLTIVLLIFLCQVVFSAILNITKNISYQTKIATIKKSKTDAENQNNKLKRELKYFSTSESLEAIARNNLKMAGNDEVLIIINEIKKQNTEDNNTNKKKKGLLYKLGKHDK
ncbi:cell division protein FtsL [bacterium]|nr:cell division protein FtsL [bacterium]